MNLQDSTIAVTGATGFVGSHIVDALLDAGATVRAVVRNPDKASRLRDQGVQIVRADIVDEGALTTAFADCDAIISNAALGSWSGEMADYERVNQTGAVNVLRAASAVGIDRVVVISTVAVYRTQLYRAVREDARSYPTGKRRFNWSDLTTDWRYARTKTVGEALCRAFADEAQLGLTFLRPSPVYGGRDPKVTKRFIDRLQQKLAVAPMVGVPFVHARDVADAAVAALRNPNSIGRAYNLAGPPVSPYTLLRTLKRLTGGGPVLVPVPIPVWVRFDTSAAAADLGFAPRSIALGLRESLDNQA